MARYFFHLQHTAHVRDEEGVELSGLMEAKCHAVKAIAESLRGGPEVFWAADEFHVTTTGADGLILFRVELLAAIAPALRAHTLG